MRHWQSDDWLAVVWIAVIVVWAFAFAGEMR